MRLVRLVAGVWIPIICWLRGVGFQLRLVTRVSIIVVRCINLAKNGIQQQRAGLAEAWAGGTVVMGSNPT